MLKYRLITGPLLVIAFLAIVLLDDWLDTVQLEGFWQDFFVGREQLPRGLALFAVSLLVTPFAAVELSAIFKADGIATRRWLTILAAEIGLIISYSTPYGLSAPLVIPVVSTALVVVFVVALLTFSQNQNVQGVVAAAGAVMFAMVYLGFMLGFLLALRRGHSAWWIVGVILITKACDTGAYFTGRAIGRRKLIPWLSPGKTWEGLAGGLVASTVIGILAALASSQWLPNPGDQIPLWLGALCGLLFGLIGQFGDLTMSLFKRGAGIKDSSSMLPGLGGVLDVMDSPLMVAPIAFWLLELA